MKKKIQAIKGLLDVFCIKIDTLLFGYQKASKNTN